MVEEKTKMGTLAEEIFSKKLGREVKAGETVITDVDYIMSHDTTTPLAIDAWKEIGKPLHNPDNIVIVFDHYYPAPNSKGSNTHKQIMKFAKKQGIKNIFFKGVCHQIMIEKGFAKPGSIVIGGDSHTCTYGALGCFSTGMGSTDIGVSWATGKNWFKIPETINIEIGGNFQNGVYAKDLILNIIRKIGANGATYKSIEFTGNAIRNMQIHQRLTLSNMAVEAGAKTGLIQTDEKTANFLGANPLAEFVEIKSNNPKYESTYNFNISNIEPQIAFPSRVDNVKPIGEFAGLDIDQVFIGTCTNGRYDDLKIAADILKKRKVARFCKTIVVPASVGVYKKAMSNGLIDIFLDAGVTVGNPGCGPCVGRHQGILADNERALTTMNRNFKGRMGNPESEIYLASPATCAATAINGKITDPRKVI
ncbi:MAG: Methanogen homoaconitase large subunit [Candidatus Woesearchaeota archaeon]|nr:Methanogen homoaconitase large subunit [Candidatus Woesearchaeota archaeon]